MDDIEGKVICYIEGNMFHEDKQKNMFHDDIEGKVLCYATQVWSPFRNRKLSGKIESVKESHWVDFKNQDWRDVLHTTTADIRTLTSLLRQRNQGPCFLFQSVVRLY